jgi:outer membrane phospholipase A
MDGLHLAYTQRSLWDLEAESAPFLDSSYMPELLYERPNLIDPDRGWLERIGGQIGFQHESNGKDGASSRSLNIAYLRMPFVFGDEDDFHVTIEPRAWFYVGELTDNPDLEDYRGHVDLRLKAGWARGLQVAAWLRAGDDFEHGSTQIDVTYPLHHLLSRSFSLYLQAQYFNGYGESLLYYNERSEVWRVGIGLFR